MESNKNVTEQGKTTGGSPNNPSNTTPQSTSQPQRHVQQDPDAANKPSTATAQPSGTPGFAGTAPQRAREIVSDVGSGVQTAYDQTVKAVSEAYDKTSEVVSSTYDQTMTYGRDNPGKLTLIAFGAGIGIGVLLASGLGGGRSRNSRFAEPIVTALSQVALQLFR
ncbi:MAG: hypothetical protein AABO57_07980 [Acidobacteriota bacterium]